MHFLKKFKSSDTCDSHWWLHTNPSKLALIHNVENLVKFRGICVESLEHNLADISETIGPVMLVFGK